jgi:hypothetical protein
VNALRSHFCYSRDSVDLMFEIYSLMNQMALPLTAGAHTMAITERIDGWKPGIEPPSARPSAPGPRGSSTPRCPAPDNTASRAAYGHGG